MKKCNLILYYIFLIIVEFNIGVDKQKSTHNI